MEIKNSEDLRTAIFKLQDKKQRDQQLLVENFHSFTQSLTPINLIKSTFNKVKETPGITGTVLKATVGLGMGMLSKKILLGNSPGFLRKILGSAVQMGIAGLVTKKSDSIASGGNELLKNIFRSKKKIGIK